MVWGVTPSIATPGPPAMAIMVHPSTWTSGAIRPPLTEPPNPPYPNRCDEARALPPLPRLE